MCLPHPTPHLIWILHLQRPPHLVSRNIILASSPTQGGCLKGKRRGQPRLLSHTDTILSAQPETLHLLLTEVFCGHHSLETPPSSELLSTASPDLNSRARWLFGSHTRTPFSSKEGKREGCCCDSPRNSSPLTLQSPPTLLPRTPRGYEVSLFMADMCSAEGWESTDKGRGGERMDGSLRLLHGQPKFKK